MPLDGQSGKACQALNLSQETCLVCGYDLRCIGYSLLISENSCTYSSRGAAFLYYEEILRISTVEIKRRDIGVLVGAIAGCI